jgi:hypothetical protein
MSRSLHPLSFEDIAYLLRAIVYHPKLGKEDAKQVLRKAGGGVSTLMDCPTSKYQDVADDCYIVLALASGKVDGRLIPKVRCDAYDAIDTERAFQDQHRQPTSLPGQLLILEKLLSDAKHHWYYDKDNNDVINHMRKIAAVAVHVMEIHGARPRKE